MWAKVSFGEYLVPVEQLGMFESLQRVEGKYTPSDAANNSTGHGFYTHWLSQTKQMPNVELFTDEQVEAMRVLGVMGGIK
jgi:hypothetical protein